MKRSKGIINKILVIFVFIIICTGISLILMHVNKILQNEELQEYWNAMSKQQRKGLQKQIEENRQILNDVALALEYLKEHQNTGYNPIAYVSDAEDFKTYDFDDYEEKPIRVPEIKDYSPEVRQMIYSGVDYYKAEDYANAKKEFLSVLETDPDNAHGGAFLAAVMFEENPEDEEAVSEALVLCRTALERNSSIEIAHLTLARIFHIRGEDRLAKPEYQEVLKINPGNTAALYAIGQILFENGEYRDAIEYFQKALEANPELVNAYIYLARIEYLLKNMEKSEEYLKTVISLNPGKISAYTLLGEIYKNNTEYDKAVDVFSEAASIQKSWEYYYNIAVCYEKQGLDSDAVENYITAVSLNPANSSGDIEAVQLIYEQIANLYRKNSNYQDAIQILQKGLEDYPDSIQLNYLSGIVYLESGRMRTAKEYLETTLRLDSAYYDAVAALAGIYLGQDEHNDAFNVIEDCLLNNPLKEQAYYELGEKLYEQGLYNDAEYILLSVLERSDDIINKERVKAVIENTLNGVMP